MTLRQNARSILRHMFENGDRNFCVTCLTYFKDNIFFAHHRFYGRDDSSFCSILGEIAKEYNCEYDSTLEMNPGIHQYRDKVHEHTVR